MFIHIASFMVALSVTGTPDLDASDKVVTPAQNVCCVLPNGQQCCAPTLDPNGRPAGCGC